MTLLELASTHNLDQDLLKEVVEVDLHIPLPSGMESVLDDSQIKRILACDGLETTDNKPFTPIIDHEILEKHEAHKKKQEASRKAAETRRKKEEEVKRKHEEEERHRIEEERRKHEAALAERMQHEEQIKKAAEEAQQRAIEERARKVAEEEEHRRQAEIDLKRREEETKMLSQELAALRRQETELFHPPVEVPVAEVVAPPVENSEAPVATPEASSAPEETGVDDTGPKVITIAESKTDDSVPVKPAKASKNSKSAPEAPKPAAPMAERKPSVLGNKLASLAKATAEKADHRVKEKSLKDLVPVVDNPKVGNITAGGQVADEQLSVEDRRRIIQENIRRNLAMQDNVRRAKQAERSGPGTGAGAGAAGGKRRNFKTIDRSGQQVSTGPSTGPRGPNTGGPRPGGPGGGPNRPGAPARGAGTGPGRDRRDHRNEGKSEEEIAARGSRRRLLSTEETDLSGRTEFSVSQPCTVRDFSEASGIKVSVVLAKLFMAGVGANINSVIEKDAIELLASEFKKVVTIRAAEDVEDLINAEHEEEDDPTQLAPRPPVVVVMGHVDHGKTSLLDAIRKTQVAAGESGGITQHIGAYTVVTPAGLQVTFIDTPGHQAFTAMRARGAHVTDIALIVVAADDGLMPQTIEAINHAKAAGVQIMVAINKMDKEGATPDKVLRQLSEQELLTEEWGGQVGCVKVSALTGQGIDELMDRLALETDILELKANHFAAASGTVLEAHISEGRGIAATLLVQRGSLAAGDIIVAGTGYGRVRNMHDWKNEKIQVAGPSVAVEVLGLSEIPRAGDRFHVMTDLKEAAAVAEERQHQIRDRELAARNTTTTLASLFEDIAEAKKKEVRLIVKADTSGSLEVLRYELPKLSSDDIKVTVIHAGVGVISMTDVSLAQASNAMVFGFHVIADAKARREAEENGVEVRTYTIIYELMDDVRKAMQGLLSPEILEEVIGHAEVLQTFKSSKIGTIAGLRISDGIVRRDARLRVTRDGVVTHEGKVGSLKRFKEDVKEVREGFECGLVIEGFQGVEVGDIIEFSSRKTVARLLTPQ